jgi:hypothetical protein
MESIITIQQVLERDKVYDTHTQLLLLDHVKASDSVTKQIMGNNE